MTIASTATAPAAVTTGRGNADSTNLPTLAQELSSTVMWAALILFVFFGVFGSWLVLAPLSSAAIATGVVSPDSSRKAVQHLEGGIIKDIHVKDGDYVNTGATLLTLDDTQSRAQFQANRAQLIRLRAIKARVQALQINAPEVAFDAETRETAATDTELALFLKAQTELFTTRRDAALGRKTVFERQIEQLREQTVGVDAELKGNLTQLSLIEEELRGLQELLKTGNALKSRVLQVQRAQAEITGKASTNRASIAGIEQKIGEVRVTMLNAETEYRDKLADELMRVNGEIAQLEEKLQATRDLLARTTVTAPTEGTVLGMRFKTTKGVIRPGDVILQIVPTKDELVIDARVQPIDGKSIRPGQMAEVHLLPYVQRNLPMIEGRVISITPDTLSDERTGEKYYEAKVIVERNRLKEIAPEVELSPGMPADVMIVTGARSAFRYLMEPIERSFRLSFRQS